MKVPEKWATSTCNGICKITRKTRTARSRTYAIVTEVRNLDRQKPYPILPGLSSIISCDKVLWSVLIVDMASQLHVRCPSPLITWYSVLGEYGSKLTLTCKPMEYASESYIIAPSLFKLKLKISVGAQFCFIFIFFKPFFDPHCFMYYLA